MIAPFPRTKLSENEIKQHTESDLCKARLQVVGKARIEREQFIKAADAAAGRPPRFVEGTAEVPVWPI